MKQVNWEELAGELENQARTVRAGEAARMLVARIAEAVSEAENNSAPAEIINRLDQLAMMITEASRKNVCTNTKCPYYDKKCRMR